MQTLMEQQARVILQTLRRHGHSAYMVGGYVRDKCLGRAVKDIDIATSALPQQVQDLFPRTIPTGLQHGTVTVLMDKFTFEVTTFRKESDYVDYRRPKQVTFVSELHEDLKRRDFTMNAMAMDESGHVIDPFGGLDDVRQGRIRCVGRAEERFTEDALRMLRCIRFAAEYELEIEEKTWEAICLLRELLQHIAIERVRMELERILSGHDPHRGLQLFVKTRLFAHIKSQMAQLTESKWEKSLTFTPLTKMTSLKDENQRWALWLIALGCDEQSAKAYLRSLSCSNQSICNITQLIAWSEAMDEIASEQGLEACCTTIR